MKKILLASALLVSSLSYGYNPDPVLSQPIETEKLNNGIKVLSGDFIEKLKLLSDQEKKSRFGKTKEDLVKDTEEKIFGKENLGLLEQSFQNFLKNQAELLYFSVEENSAGEAIMKNGFIPSKLKLLFNGRDLNASDQLVGELTILYAPLTEHAYNKNEARYDYYRNKLSFYALACKVAGLDVNALVPQQH